MSIFFLKAWAWIKKHWRLIVLVLSALAAVVLFRRNIVDFVEDYRKIQQIHSEELQEIERARQEEKTRLEANRLRLEQTLKTIQDQYDAEQLELDAKKKKEIKTIVEKHGDDPEALAEELSRVTGFRVIMPQE